MSRSFKRMGAVFTLLATAACTQPAAQVDLRGQNSFSRTGGSNYASTPSYQAAPVYAKSYSQQTYNNAQPSRPVPMETEQRASVQSIGINDLTPPKKGDKQSSVDTGASVNPWTNKPRFSDAGPSDSFAIQPKGKQSGGSQMISQIKADDKPVAQLDTVISREKTTGAAKEVKLSKATRENGAFMWPVSGKKVISTFGAKGGGKVNDGINIASAEGEPVWAAADGEVLYVGNELKGYGNMVIIKHAGDKNTTYAHLSSSGVDKYDRVKQGDIIGYVGSTGSVKTPQLHFAIRDGKEPVDPQKFMNRSVAGL